MTASHSLDTWSDLCISFAFNIDCSPSKAVCFHLDKCKVFKTPFSYSNSARKHFSVIIFLLLAVKFRNKRASKTIKSVDTAARRRKPEAGKRWCAYWNHFHACYVLSFVHRQMAFTYINILCIMLCICFFNVVITLQTRWRADFWIALDIQWCATFTDALSCPLHTNFYQLFLLRDNVLPLQLLYQMQISRRLFWLWQKWFQQAQPFSLKALVLNVLYTHGLCAMSVSHYRVYGHLQCLHRPCTRRLSHRLSL